MKANKGDYVIFKSYLDLLAQGWPEGMARRDGGRVCILQEYVDEWGGYWRARLLSNGQKTIVTQWSFGSVIDAETAKMMED